MERSEMLRAFDLIFDQALIFHGFTDYMRDYQMITQVFNGSAGTSAPSFYKFTFRYCVEAGVATSLSPQVWRNSLDERFLSCEAVDASGFRWGCRWQNLYPGIEMVDHSERAQQWSEKIGIDFHEVHVDTGIQKMVLVFSDLEVVPVELGYTPFVVTG